MNLKQIIQTGFFIGGLSLAVNAFAETPPKVHANELISLQFTEQENILNLGYDTNQDRVEDVMLKYKTETPHDGSLYDFYLMDYAVDLNKDKRFDDNEWFGNLGYLEMFKEGKENLLEVDPNGLLFIDGFFPLDFSTSKKTITFEYEKYGSFFDSFLEIGEGFVIKDDSPGGERYAYAVDSHHINKMWPSQHVANVHLDSYAIDKNNDLEFSDDEWIGY